MAKIEPAVTQLLYQVPNGASYIDLAKDLSKVNRRLYRQGMTYVVQDVQWSVTAGMKVTDIQGLTFQTSGNSWIVHNAWKKAYAAWRNQIKSVTAPHDGGPGDHGRHHHGAGMSRIEGKWADFKVYLDDAHEDGTTLEPYAGDNAVYLAGEWEHSKLVFDDDGTEREFKMHLIGSSNLTDTNNESGIGLIHEYQISRRRPQDPDPDVPADANNSIYAKMLGTDEMSDMLVDNIEGDNDSAPYDDVEYPGGATNADSAVPVRFGSVTAQQAQGVIPGFIAPCGLIKVHNGYMALQDADGNGAFAIDDVYAAGTAQTAIVLVTVATGPYRGVLAAPMGQ